MRGQTGSTVHSLYCDQRLVFITISLYAVFTCLTHLYIDAYKLAIANCGNDLKNKSEMLMNSCTEEFLIYFELGHTRAWENLSSACYHSRRKWYRFVLTSTQNIANSSLTSAIWIEKSLYSR